MRTAGGGGRKRALGPGSTLAGRAAGADGAARLPGLAF